MNFSIFNNKVIYRPWPVVVNGEVHSGSKFNMPECCNNKCYSNDDTNVCAHGFSYFRKIILGENFIVGGVCKDKVLVPKKFKKFAMGRFFSECDIDEWIKNIEYLFKGCGGSVNQDEIFKSLHDAIRWSSQVNNIAKKMISRNESNFLDDFNSATKEKKAILKASQMLVDSFDHLSIYLNPESASFGKKKSTDVYRLIHKISIILEFAEGNALNKKIKIKGCSDHNHDLYESFKVIPSCILQNAMKYSSQRDIEVEFDQTQSGLYIKFSSFGPYIECADIDKIFEKGFRGKWASKIHHEGMGVGLYISKIVAEAHGFQLLAESICSGHALNGIPQGTTIFKLYIQNNKYSI